MMSIIITMAATKARINTMGTATAAADTELPFWVSGLVVVIPSSSVN